MDRLGMLRASPMPFVKWVFPAPSSPSRQMMLCSGNSAMSFLPRAMVSSGDDEVHFMDLVCLILLAF
jgi:hypothetical protein